MRVLFATAELSPLVKVGGLGDAVAGLVEALCALGVDVEVVVPDYRGDHDGDGMSLGVPEFAGPATCRTLESGLAQVTQVSAPGLARPHPYTDDDGRGWPDNPRRFLAFSAAVAALATHRKPDVLHLNDWHTGATLGFLSSPVASILTMHNPAYQGAIERRWLESLPHRSDAYEWQGRMNPLVGAVVLADWVTTVSPSFSRELLAPSTGFGLSELLQKRRDRFSGILNGLDIRQWDPSADPHLPARFDVDSIGRRAEVGARLRAEIGWEPNEEPVIGMVARLTDQKGVDLALAAADDLAALSARMILLGSGDRQLADLAATTARRSANRLVFREGFDEGLAHRIFGGSDLFLVPSRFEPCGLTQIQAMRYGSIPVVTDVGGLHDTVQDADADPERGTGFMASDPTPAAVHDALRRAVTAWRSEPRRHRLMRLGMSRDWSWDGPARAYLDVYQEITSAR